MTPNPLQAPPALYVVGDIHGYRERMGALLQQAGLIDEHERWCGGDAVLWFTGDLCDRGPDGVGAYDLVMQLQDQAVGAGGAVGMLLGNHDLALLAAYLLGDRPSHLKGGSYLRYWLRYGGIPSDMKRLRPPHVDWLLSRPIMARQGDWLLVHADGRFYQRYGATLAEVNASAGSLMAGDDTQAWDCYLDDFTERYAFEDPDGETLNAFFKAFGGQRLVHGHTPLPERLDRPPATITAPYTYAAGRAVNVDGGIYMGGPGFVARL